MFMAYVYYGDRFMVYTYLQTHQVECIKFVQLLVCQSDFNKVVKKCIYFAIRFAVSP